MQRVKIIWENAEPWTWQFTVLALKGKDKRHACVGLLDQMGLSFKQSPEENKPNKQQNNKNQPTTPPQNNTIFEASEHCTIQWKAVYKQHKSESRREICNREGQPRPPVTDWCFPWSNDSTGRTQLWNLNPHPKAIPRMLSWLKL